jgi:hypothetical protein
MTSSDIPTKPKRYKPIKFFSCKINGKKVSRDDMQRIASLYRRDCIAEYIKENYVVSSNHLAARIALDVMECMDHDELTESEALSKIMHVKGINFRRNYKI